MKVFKTLFGVAATAAAGFGVYKLLQNKKAADEADEFIEEDLAECCEDICDEACEVAEEVADEVKDAE